MRPFAYHRATSVADAIATSTGTPGATFLAGGTSLIDLMKQEISTPSVLVDVSHLPLTDVVDEGPQGLRVGALMLNSDLAADPRIRTMHPLLSRAINSGASPQIRHMATVGGNLLQQTRCPYFWEAATPCHRRSPGSGCAALNGRNGDAAILGSGNPCVATHPSDLAVALAASNATLHTRGTAGSRALSIAELCVGGNAALAQGELVTHLQLAGWSPRWRFGYRKVRTRASFTFALVSVAAAMHVVDSVIDDVRIAWGAIATTPWRAYRAEELLRGQAPTNVTFGQAVDTELYASEPLSDNAFKLPLIREVTVNLLHDLAHLPRWGRQHG